MKSINALLNTQIYLPVSTTDLVMFTKHLAVMLESGITLAESLQALVSQTHSPTMRHVLNDIVNRLENGMTFGKALARHPKVFDNFYVSLIQVGEESGKLQENLIYLADHLKKENASRNKVIGAMIYPSIVLVFSAVVGVSMSLFVLPTLIPLFEGLDVELPLTTKVLLTFSILMRDQGLLLLIGTIMFFVLLRLITMLNAVKPHWQRFLFKVPIIGSILLNSKLASFCRNVGLMMKSGLTVVEACKIQYQVEQNLVFKGTIKRIQDGLNKGQSIGKVLSQASNTVFPPLSVKMIGVGEKTGKLDESLLYLAEFFDEELDGAIKNLTTTIEPLMLLGIGLVVAFVALSIVTPIYQFTGSIKR